MEKRYVSVSAINRYLKTVISRDQQLQLLYVKGEISNFKHHSSGHLYFSLKDENSRIQAVMFSSYASKLQFNIEDGMQVIVCASLAVYETAGTYQLYVKDLQIDGLGQLYLQYQQLKEKLYKEGLFDPLHKKTLPRYPMNIGVISSPKGAAVQDIIRTIHHYFPIAQVIVCPALVQGKEAPLSIVQAIEQIDRCHMDVLILARGGGSIEDLWAFNDENVVRAVYHCQTPIISGVGHEVDTTLVDYVCDQVAPTPTGAAMMAVPDIREVLGQILKNQQYLNVLIKKKIDQHKNRLSQYTHHYILKNYPHYLEEKSMMLDHLDEKFHHDIPIHLKMERQKLDVIIQLFSSLAQQWGTHQKNDLNQVTMQLNQNIENLFHEKKQKLAFNVVKMDAFSPLNVLKRGYTLVYKDDVLMKSSSQLHEHDEITLRFADGNKQAMIK